MTLRGLNVVVELVEHRAPWQVLVSAVLASMPVTGLNEDTPVDVNAEDIVVGVSNFSVEVIIDGSVNEEVLRGRTVLGESVIVVPRSVLLFCVDSVVYRNVVLTRNVTSVPWSVVMLVTVDLSSF